jgi:hypothetical protein
MRRSTREWPWDADLPSYMLHAYFEKLFNVRCTRCTSFGKARKRFSWKRTHQPFQAVQQFLEENMRWA